MDVEVLGTRMGSFRDFLAGQFQPGSVCAFVGAGGKTTGMRAAAAFCAGSGLRVRMTTTTRVAVDEFPGVPVRMASSAREFEEAVSVDEPLLLIVAEELPGERRYRGVDPSFIDGALPGPDEIVLVEADGSRRRPLKAPTTREPVIPQSTAVVLAIMGARGFDEPIDEESCYNHDGVLRILGKEEGRFDAPTIAQVAASPQGSRKGVGPGMGFHIVMNQGDIEEKRATARAALEMLWESGVSGSLLSWQKEELYETSER